MSMSKVSMANFIQSHIDVITDQKLTGASTGAAVALSRREYLEAFCQGIIDEIINGAVVQTTSGAPDGEHIGNVVS